MSPRWRSPRPPSRDGTVPSSTDGEHHERHREPSAPPGEGFPRIRREHHRHGAGAARHPRCRTPRPVGQPLLLSRPSPSTPRRPRAGSSTSSATASGTSPGSGRSSKRSSPRDHSFRDLEVEHDFEGIGRRRMLLNGRKVWREGNHSELILLAIEDITELWRAGVELEGQPRAIPPHRRGGHRLRHLHDRHARAWSPPGTRGPRRSSATPRRRSSARTSASSSRPRTCEAGAAEVEMRTAEAEGRALDERWHLRKGGERFWANGLVMPLKDDADRTRGFLKILRDMSRAAAARGVAPPADGRAGARPTRTRTSSSPCSPTS